MPWRIYVEGKLILRPFSMTQELSALVSLYKYTINIHIGNIGDLNLLHTKKQYDEMNHFH